MKSILRMLFVFALLAPVCLAQNVVIKHKVYTTTFNKTYRFPVVVKWWLTKAMLHCQNPLARPDCFCPDPLLPFYTDLDSDYYRKGFDRGHNCDAADCRCDTVAEYESFYYSNMCPQTATLNRGIWKKLEDSCRTIAESYDSTLIWCGSVAKASAKKIGPDSMVVPNYCWKIVYIKRRNKTLSYVFPNDTVLSGQLSSYLVSADSVKHLSGIKFTKSR